MYVCIYSKELRIGFVGCVHARARIYVVGELLCTDGRVAYERIIAGDLCLL